MFSTILYTIFGGAIVFLGVIALIAGYPIHGILLVMITLHIIRKWHKALSNKSDKK